MKTIFIPNGSETNPYANNVVAVLNEQEVETYGFKDIVSKRVDISEIEIANLNWFENFNSRWISKSIYYALRRILQLLYLRMHKVKIFYTFHNKTTHDGWHPKINAFVFRNLLKCSDKILLVSQNSKWYIDKQIGQEASDKKCYFVGHPLYKISEQTDGTSNKKEVTFLFFGMVRPYKNIELLIKAWSNARIENAKLIIAGKPNMPEYGELINEMCANIPNIELVLEYIPDERLDAMIASSDIVVSPLQKSSSTNSGTLMKTVSSRKNIIIPAIEMAKDLGLENMFSYDYNSEQEHLDKLKDELKYAADLYLNHPDEYKAMTDRLYQKTVDINGDNKIRERYRRLYYGTTSGDESRRQEPKLK